jgi:hypothetical protein
MVNCRFMLGQLGRRAEAVAVHQEVERRFADATEPELRAQVEMADRQRRLADLLPEPGGLPDDHEALP